MKFRNNEIIFYTLFAISFLFLIASIVILPYTKVNRLRIDLIGANIKAYEDKTKHFKEEISVKAKVEKEFNEKRDKIVKEMTLAHIPEPVILLFSKIKHDSLSSYSYRFLLKAPLLDRFAILGLFQYVVIRQLMNEKIDYEEMNKYFYSLPKFKEFEKTYKDQPEKCKEAIAEQFDNEFKIFDKLEISDLLDIKYIPETKINEW